MHPAFAMNAHFPHRTNYDGTIDSICPRCYITVGSSTRESDLKRMERAHVCNPALLKHYREQSQPAKKPPSQQKSLANSGHRSRAGA